jgi:3',5'-cyclic AMP phosphodiesterase CpdA
VRRSIVISTTTAAMFVAGVLGASTLAGADVAPTGTVRIAAVGDIACKDPAKNNKQVCQYDDVADGIARRDYDAFIPLGDIQYEYGLYKDFIENYDLHFGRLLPITYPIAGNHEYGKSPDAAGYFRYYGDRAPAAYYSFDLGAWHLIGLDSTICRAGGVECRRGSPQFEWLKADLAANDVACTLVFWHHPRWDHLKYQNADWTQDYELRRTEPLYDLLYRQGADILLAGHNHNYSRWFPADADGNPDRANGITQYIVGTGGRNLNGFGNFHTRPDIFVRGQSKAFGHLQLDLAPGGWDFRWISAPGQPSYVDEGSGTCH